MSTLERLTFGHTLDLGQPDTCKIGNLHGIQSVLQHLDEEFVATLLHPPLHSLLHPTLILFFLT